MTVTFAPAEVVMTANVLLAQDDDIDREILTSFRDRLQALPKVNLLALDPSASSGSSASAEPSISSDLGKGVEYLDLMIAWADLFVVVLGADSLAKMLQGITNNSPLLTILRSWDVSKKILWVPFMSNNAWSNPMTKKQLGKIRRKWKWIRVLEEPILCSGGQNPKETLPAWLGMDEMIKIVRSQAEILSIGKNVDTPRSSPDMSTPCRQSRKASLPLEIWSMILEYGRDWELAQALGIYTRLRVPLEWTKLIPCQRSTLEWAILKGSLADFITRLPAKDPPKWLSSMSMKLVIKFARIDILEYLENSHKVLFWTMFGHKYLPTKASAVFPQTMVLEWWKNSASFLTKEYSTDAIDLASKAGFIHVLDWWRASGLPLRYTEAALEQAKGIDVLDWWKAASKPSTKNQARFQLKVGKSLLLAAQNGQAEVIAWWARSGISTGHEDAVARTASTNGHVDVLQQWKICKGDKMQFDNHILVGPTRNGHVEVMEWWKQSGYRVEYKTCDIEEALEDSSGGSIRTWWAQNGLNLGMGTSEWMKVKVL
ncbi:MAG: hypothetical protein Q9195_005700 [Heterodermia aff. obscurata]